MNAEKKTKKDKKQSIRDKVLEDVKGDFITIASHQLRTPISAIRWSLDTLLNDKVGQLSERQKDVIREAYENNKFLAKAVNDLLRASRLEEKTLQLIPEKVDVEQFIKNSVERFRRYAEAHNVKIEIKNANAPLAYIDSLQFKPMFEGLIDNAIRYTKLSGRPGEIEISLKPAENYCLLTISDNGIGIPSDQQSLVFTRFFRGKNAMKAQTEGLGLDLYIAKQLIERSGGKISFTSVEDKGTTIYVYLPTKGKDNKVEDISKDFQVDARDADKTLKQEREFVAITVHELKAPLGMTKWSLELLKKGKAGSLSQEQLELINQIYRGNERLLILVRDLLDLSKLQEGRFDVEFEPIDLKLIINDSIAGFVSQAKRKNIKLELPKNDDIIWPEVKGDTNRVTQVITNLVSNAIKYTPDKGQVSISIKTVTGKQLKEMGEQISTADIINNNNKKGYVVISIADTGIGISESDQSKLFTRFFRSKNVMQTKTEGTGLGLYITKTIVNLHGGDIWFTSHLGQGSVFFFSLPIA